MFVLALGVANAPAVLEASASTTPTTGAGGTFVFTTIGGQIDSKRYHQKSIAIMVTAKNRNKKKNNGTLVVCLRQRLAWLTASMPTNTNPNIHPMVDACYDRAEAHRVFSEVFSILGAQDLFQNLISWRKE